MRNRVRRTPKPQDNTYIQEVLSALKSNPEKIEILARNCDEYKQQMHLKRGFLRAIERLEWVIHASKDIEQFEKSILADDYIGEVIRRYPLLFKGIKG